MMRVISGTLKAGAELVNSKTGATEKLNKLFFLCGKEADGNGCCRSRGSGGSDKAFRQYR